METLIWNGHELKILDQTKLPGEVTYLACRQPEQVAEAIRRLQVRGAPAIGVAAAYGVVLGAQAFLHRAQGEKKGFAAWMKKVFMLLRQTRPTAVNLFWALARMEKKLKENLALPFPQLLAALTAEAEAIFKADIEANKRLGAYGQELLPDGASVLTHCNAGALATAGYGTALGVVRAARERGKKITVYVDETRPLLQGARLTTWELCKEGIPVTLIPDSAAGYLFQQGKIDFVLVGADRIAANGDAANKVGTYSLAVLAKYHGRPFYVAAPVSTIDLSLKEGREILIEERDGEEVRCLGGYRIAPAEVPVYNPAFDLTPHSLISALITDKGVFREPYTESLTVLRNVNKS